MYKDKKMKLKLNKIQRGILGLYGAFMVFAALNIINIEGIEFDSLWLWCLTLGLIALVIATAKTEEKEQ